MRIEMTHESFQAVMAGLATTDASRALALQTAVMDWAVQATKDLEIPESDTVTIRYDTDDLEAPPWVEVYSLDENRDRFTFVPLVGMSGGVLRFGPPQVATEWVEARTRLPDEVISVLKEFDTDA